MQLFMTRRGKRKGVIVVLTAFLMVSMLAFLAFAVDAGYMLLVRSELQHAADASALAAAGVMYDPPNSLETPVFYQPPEEMDVRQMAGNYVGLNGIRMNDHAGLQLQVDPNMDNAAMGDVVVGRINVPADQSELFLPTIQTPNSVMVRVPMRSGHANGKLSLFFAPILGINDTEIVSSAVATVDYPSLLPFATSDGKWNTIASGGDFDNYSYVHGKVVSGGDGIPEVQIFPDNHWNGDGLPPGNFGALEIGGVGSTAVLRAQIDMGPSKAEMDYHGGSFATGMQISGKTGVNGDIKTAFYGGNADGRQYGGILGKARYMPIYSDVSGNGSNSLFTISRFVAVRVMYTKMTGGNKYIIVQPITEEESLVNVRLTR